MLKKIIGIIVQIYTKRVGSEIDLVFSDPRRYTVVFVITDAAVVKK